MIRITNLTIARGAKRLLDGASLTVHPGHKLGIVGANGSGKSSLFAALRNELIPDAGSIDIPAAWTIAHVAQETPPVATSALDYVLDGDAELRSIEQALAAAEADPAHSGEALADLHHRFEIVGGYSAPARAATLLAGLGFVAARHADPVASFSGGWRMRLNLAQALMCRSDLLLLDEPTNHLDLDAVLWLEDWLGKYPGTLLLITHDRDFLDAVVDGIVHVDARKLVALHRQLRAVRARARGPAGAAAGDVREAAAAGRAPAVVHRPLSREGDQGQAGAEPDQGAGADGADRRRARRQPVRVQLRVHGEDRAPARAARGRGAGLSRPSAGAAPT